MGLAAIIVCFNDEYKIKEWYENYQCYKNAVDYLIIVDNGSENMFLNQVKNMFCNAEILELKKNLGSTNAYNEGIKCALKYSLVDAIMLIGNDIKISDEDIKRMYHKVISDESVGMIGPVMLKKDSMIIDGIGYTFNKHYNMYGNSVGELYHKKSLMKPYIEVQAVAGGMNIASRKTYEEIGLQDEKLFMYADELDTSIRLHKINKKILVDTHACAWHQHINKPGRDKRSPFVAYLIARNNTYIIKKHLGRWKAACMIIYVILSSLRLCAVGKLNYEAQTVAKRRIQGAIKGYKGDMKLPEGLWI